MGDRRSPVGVVGLAAVAVGVCCAFPILVSVGIAGVIAGLSSGTWVLIAAAMGVAIVGFSLLARGGSHRQVLSTTTAAASTGHSDTHRSTTDERSNRTSR